MKEKFYPVFEVDICFTPYAMDYSLVGAESVNDRAKHIEEIFTSEIAKAHIGDVKKHRIKQIEGLFTKEPYKIITTYAYYE